MFIFVHLGCSASLRTRFWWSCMPSYVEQPGAPYRPAWVPGHLGERWTTHTFWLHQRWTFGSETVFFLRYMHGRNTYPFEKSSDLVVVVWCRQFERWDVDMLRGQSPKFLANRSGTDDCPYVCWNDKNGRSHTSFKCGLVGQPWWKKMSELGCEMLWNHEMSTSLLRGYENQGGSGSKPRHTEG